jgi:hypothetical protein
MRPTPRCFLPSFLLVVASSSAFAQTGSIQGRSPIVPLVVASLGLPIDSAFPPPKPDSDTTFSQATQTTEILASGATMDLWWDVGTLVVRSRSAEPVRVDVFSISGCRLATMRQSTTGGEVRFRLEGILGEGIHALCLRQGTWSFRWTQAGLPASGNIGFETVRNAD